MQNKTCHEARVHLTIKNQATAPRRFCHLRAINPQTSLVSAKLEIV